MKLSLVEPFASRPAVEEKGEVEQKKGFQLVQIKPVESSAIEPETQSSRDQHRSWDQKVLIEFINKYRKKVGAASNQPHSDKTRAKILTVYEKMRDYQGPLDVLGNRLDKRI